MSLGPIRTADLTLVIPFSTFGRAFVGPETEMALIPNPGIELVHLADSRVDAAIDPSACQVPLTLKVTVVGLRMTSFGWVASTPSGQADWVSQRSQRTRRNRTDFPP